MVQEMTRQQIAHRILQVFLPLMRIVAAEVRRTEYAVAPAHFGLLTMLNHGSSSLGELAEKQGVSLPTISNSVSTLAERGWITRSPSKRDRRVMVVELTPLGEQILADIQACVEERVMGMLAGLSQGELEQLIGSMEILDNVLPYARQSTAA
jgi:DNA-binding MarR family transcriptional regulator